VLPVRRSTDGSARLSSPHSFARLRISEFRGQPQVPGLGALLRGSTTVSRALDMTHAGCLVDISAVLHGLADAPSSASRPRERRAAMTPVRCHVGPSSKVGPKAKNFSGACAEPSVDS